MSFSSTYFSKYLSHPQIFHHHPDKNTGIIVVIPCYDDEFVYKTLTSLENTDNTKSHVEIIVIVNSGENTPDEIVEKNRNTYNKLKEKSDSEFYKRFTLLPVLIENIRRKKAGVGYARKTGMDEAVRRFSALNNPNGIIASLDADTLVATHYFTAIEKAFAENPHKGAYTFQYQHDFNPQFYSQEVIKACKLYEIYLRCYKIALTVTGFPYYFHTIGSCFAVNAVSYIKAGGMPTKQGGEDFYFLHKLAQTTKIGETDDILVYPSPRISDRVPFGTGPSVKSIINAGGYRVYNFELFLILQKLFGCFENFANSDKIDLNSVPAEIINFVGEKNFLKIVEECKQNTNGSKNFTKRLFSVFDAFFIVKFLNTFDDESIYPQVDVLNMADMLLNYCKNQRLNSDTLQRINPEIKNIKALIDNL